MGSAAAGYGQSAEGISSARSSVLSSRAQAMKNAYKSQFGRQFVASKADNTPKNHYTDPAPSYQQSAHSTYGQHTSNSKGRKKKSRWE